MLEGIVTDGLNFMQVKGLQVGGATEGIRSDLLDIVPGDSELRILQTCRISHDDGILFLLILGEQDAVETLVFRVGRADSDAGQRLAVAEGTVAHTCHIAAECHLGETVATEEGFLADGGQFAGEGGGRQHRTTLESTLTDGGDGGGESNGGEEGTSLESVVRNGGQTCEVLQFLEGEDIRIAGEYGTETGDGFCLSVTEFSVLIGIPVLQADGLHIFILEDDKGLEGLILAEVFPDGGSMVGVFNSTGHSQCGIGHIDTLEGVGGYRKRIHPSHLHIIQSRAVAERFLADSGHGTTHVDSGESCCAEEGLRSNGGHLFGEGDGGEGAFGRELQQHGEVFAEEYACGTSVIVGPQLPAR